MAEHDEGTTSEPEVLAGYFAFADGMEFRRALAVCQGDFVGAVNHYGKVRPLRLQRVSTWLDCGHLQTYYRSRCSMRIQRSFNQLAISYQVVEKRSHDAAKVQAEASWFEQLPPRMRMHTPAFLGRLDPVAGDGATPAQPAGYAIEYLPMPSLHELLVFAAVGSAGWRHILEGIFAFMQTGLEHGRAAAPGPVIAALTADKTEARLRGWLATAGIPEDRAWRYQGRAMPAPLEIARQTAALIDTATPDFLGIMHGDLCFTNMFYDFRTQRIKVIDPRGTVDGQAPTVFGDLRYDMAKINHSIVGAYDFILAGRYRCEGFEAGDLSIGFPHDSSLDRVTALAGAFDLNGRRLGDPEFTAMTIHLFLSMLPLHADNPGRQRAFLANALRLFAERLGA